MKMITANVELINQPDPLKLIEHAGRLCYKSENAVSEDSSVKFVQKLIKNDHTAMLEHGTFCFKVTDVLGNTSNFMKYLMNLSTNRFLNVSVLSNQSALVSGNFRTVLERKLNDPILRKLHSMYPKIFELNEDESYAGIGVETYALKLDRLSATQFDKHKYVTLKITCDRGVSHELVRHRIFSFAQESTRYCNYNSDKFNRELTFIQPADYDTWSLDNRLTFESSLKACEAAYLELTNTISPQLARAVLPHATKTEVMMTGNIAAWKHFLDLRYHGTTGQAHPDMRYIASKIYRLLVAEDLINES